MASIAKKKPSFTAPAKDQPTLLKRPNEKLITGFYLFLAFFVPFILMFIAFAIAKVAPFGDKQILATDLWHQYYPFLVDYHDKLQNGGSLLWTWSSGGGTNYPALMAYYTASPLNLLSVFFPASALREFVYVTTCVKIGLAGLFFALFLRITFKRRDVTITAFGIMYALCAFIMGYYWNIIWLDTIALVPLVIAGTIALLRDGRFRLYIAALSLSLIANYYMALFTCIFVALVSIGYTIVEWKSWRKTLRDFFKMAGCTIVSFMISAALIIPVYFALKTTYSADNTYPQTFAVNMGGTADFGGVLTGMGKTIANSIAQVHPTAKEGLPNVYCGVFTIFLAFLFLFCSKIKLRERLYCLGMLLFFMVSFVIRQLDYIWHGFHFPNMLPYRFSFLFSFVVLYMAFRVFTHIDAIRPVSVIAATCSFLIYLGIAARYYNEGISPSISSAGDMYKTIDERIITDPVMISGFFGLVIALSVLLYSLRGYLKRPAQAVAAACICVGSGIFIALNAKVFLAPLRKREDLDNDAAGFIIAILIIMAIAAAMVGYAVYSKQLNKDHRALRTMLSGILIVLALVEGSLSAANGVSTVHVTDRDYYPLGTENTLAMADAVKEREADTVDIYRTELTRYWTLNDPTLIGVNGISMFSSMTTRNVTDYLEKFGICGWIASNRYTYQESSPFTNMMLNIKYLIAPNGGDLRDQTNLEQVAQQQFSKLFLNKYYLPMGFLVNDDLLRYDITVLSPSDPFYNQNLFFRLATGLDGDLYEVIPSANDGSSHTEVLAPHAGIAVAYTTTSQKDAYDVTLYRRYKTQGTNAEGETILIDEDLHEKADIQRSFIMMLGSVNAGDKLTVEARTGSINTRYAMFNEDLFLQAYEKFSRSTLRASEVGDDYIRGNINAVEDGLFYTSIPASGGWKAYVDGEETEITPVGGALVAFRISKGAHIIELKYWPEGLTAGLILCVLGLLLFIAMIILSWRKINLLDMVLVKCGVSPAASKGLADDSEPAAPAGKTSGKSSGKSKGKAIGKTSSKAKKAAPPAALDEPEKPAAETPPEQAPIPADPNEETGAGLSPLSDSETEEP